MKKILSALLLLCTLSISAQDAVDKSFKKYVPLGYELYEVIKGDLNKDGEEDCVIIFQEINKANLVKNSYGEIDNRNRRGILVLIKKQNNYVVVSKNYSCLLSNNEDNMNYESTEESMFISNNKFYISYTHGRDGEWKYTFRYQNGNMELIGYDALRARGGTILSEVSVNFSTKKKLYKKNIKEDTNEEEFVETWSTIDMKENIKLSRIPSFETLHFGE